MHRGFFLPVKAFPPAPNGPGTGGGRCHATYLCGERFNSRPPRGERPAAVHPALAATSFQSTPSARRATAAMNASIKAIELFQSTPSARRATYRICPPLNGRQISIHALREEGDLPAHSRAAGRGDFNPRPPRGGRLGFKVTDDEVWEFQSTPSARRATLCLSETCETFPVFQSTPSARRATRYPAGL